ncbi:MAG: hypothetical protein IOC82_03475 [Aestuariivirga sp.]|uniref:hypothetical protein n=1 Tax=Aestuariivirga sp. TaxID=2650926 RepID=UPI0025B942C6|nr:hypothetical protein [Aestuariivirga sp.]MCA3560075.1 hypothetical protein [Aestuariivirga sp.]
MHLAIFAMAAPGRAAATGMGFDAEEFVLKLKDQNVTPHIAINGASYILGDPPD